MIVMCSHFLEFIGKRDSPFSRRGGVPFVSINILNGVLCDTSNHEMYFAHCTETIFETERMKDRSHSGQLAVTLSNEEKRL